MPIKINGSTSGSVTLAAPATGSDVTLTLPTDLNAKAPLNMSVNPQTGTSYTLTTSDSANIITMTNAAASTVTIPTNASAAIPIGTSTEIVNLSTGVNTTISAAGGVTFNGGPVVLSPGSSVTLVKIGTDAWMAQGQGSPGLVHINTTTFSAVSSVSVNNCFSGAYDNYLVTATITPSTSAQLRMRLRTGGVDASASNYVRMAIYGRTSTSGGVGATDAHIALLLSDYSGEAQVMVDLAKPFLAVPTPMQVRGSDPSGETLFSGVRHSLSTSYDGFSIITSTGTITGTVRCYAYRS